MPLPASWIDHLFGRLALRYGEAFKRQWPDADIEAVKADWADVLDGVQGDSISYALRYLPERPPNAIVFRDICRRAPRVEPVSLPAPAADPERVAAAVAAVTEKPMRPPGMTEAQFCAYRLREIAKVDKLNKAQREMLAACERVGA